MAVLLKMIKPKHLPLRARAGGALIFTLSLLGCDSISDFEISRRVKVAAPALEISELQYKKTKFGVCVAAHYLVTGGRSVEYGAVGESQYKNHMDETNNGGNWLRVTSLDDFLSHQSDRHLAMVKDNISTTLGYAKDCASTPDRVYEMTKLTPALVNWNESGSLFILSGKDFTELDYLAGGN